MTSKEKKDIVLREVVKPELKLAGYRSTKLGFTSMREDCCLIIHLFSNRFNSVAMGFNFGLEIEAVKGKQPAEHPRYRDFRERIHEDILLPDCGFLHPYHDPLGYKIDGYKDYKPQDMDVEDIKRRIGDDLRQYILPELAEVKCYEDWTRKRQEWNERANSKRVCLLRLLYHAHHYQQIQSGNPNLLDIRQKDRISAQEIKENYSLYRQIKALSAHPNDDNWPLILSALATEETNE